MSCHLLRAATEPLKSRAKLIMLLSRHHSADAPTWCGRGPNCVRSGNEDATREKLRWEIELGQTYRTLQVAHKQALQNLARLVAVSYVLESFR
jgi:hypothetical protein